MKRSLCYLKCWIKFQDQFVKEANKYMLPFHWTVKSKNSSAQIFSQFNLSALSLGFIHLILYSFCDLVSSFFFDRILFDKSNNHFKGSTKEHQRLELSLVILDNITNDKNYEGQMKSTFFHTKGNKQPLFESFIDLKNI